MHFDWISDHRRQVTNAVRTGSICILLCLVPSVVYAHDPLGAVINLSHIIVVFCQFLYGVIMLWRKKKELEANSFLVSGLYVGVLGIFWAVLLYVFPWPLGYIFTLGHFVDATIAVVLIFSLLYFVVLPLVTTYLVALALYRKYRQDPLCTEPPFSKL